MRKALCNTAAAETSSPRPAGNQQSDIPSTLSLVCAIHLYILSLPSVQHAFDRRDHAHQRKAATRKPSHLNIFPPPRQDAFQALVNRTHSRTHTLRHEKRPSHTCTRELSSICPLLPHILLYPGASSNLFQIFGSVTSSAWLARLTRPATAVFAIHLDLVRILSIIVPIHRHH